jgi:hypothetical protein
MIPSLLACCFVRSPHNNENNGLDKMLVMATELELGASQDSEAQ